MSITVLTHDYDNTWEQNNHQAACCHSQSLCAGARRVTLCPGTAQQHFPCSQTLLCCFRGTSLLFVHCFQTPCYEIWQKWCPRYNPFSGWSICHSAMTERPRPATGSSGCSQNINTLLQAELQWQEITMRVPLAIAGQTSKLLFNISQGAFTKLHETRCNVSACARPRAYQCGAVWTWTLWVGARVESRAAGCQRVTNAGFPRSGRERDACRNRPPAVSFYGFRQERSRAVW